MPEEALIEYRNTAPISSEGEPDPRKVEGTAPSSVDASVEPPDPTIGQVFAFNSVGDSDVKDTSGTLHNKGPEAGGQSGEFHIGKEEGHLLLFPSQELSASTTSVLAGLVYDLFPSGVLDQWIHNEGSYQSDSTSIYLTLKYSTRNEWLDFFHRQEIHTQRALFHSSSMQNLLLTRASRADGLS